MTWVGMEWGGSAGVGSGSKLCYDWTSAKRCAKLHSNFLSLFRVCMVGVGVESLCALWAVCVYI